ncbi:MAG TPA: hypothetical protein PKO06_18390 [Candidatus Ozemobacteraceae bacterium]|nr:hypothetical protein [Candidatus Ozemobacteraceae bacterium]
MNIRVFLIISLFFIGMAVHGESTAPEVAPATTDTAIVRESMDADTSFGLAGFNTTSGKFDRNADGKIDLIVVDRNADGRGDYWATDRNFDGLIDDYQYDRNFDGRIDQWEYDTFHNGVPEKIYVDSNGSGRPDMYAVLNPYTRTYTWYGNLKALSGSGFSSGIRPRRGLNRGRGGDSE